jgi:outer membrane receptor protein involved in Fe transport
MGKLSTSGVDLDFAWSPALNSMGMDAVGNLFFRTNVSYTDTFEIQTLEGDPVVDYIHTISVGNSHPRWKSMTDLGYQNDSFTIGLRWRYLESMDDVTVITTPATPQPGTETYNTYDLYGTWSPTDKFTIRAGVSNLSDELSVRVSTSQWSTDPALYDPTGRQWYLGMSFSL